jgi:hypothetical protein
MSTRTNIILQAYDEVLERPSMDSTTLLPRASTPTSRRHRPSMETPERPSHSNSFSSTGLSNSLRRNFTQSKMASTDYGKFSSSLPRFSSDGKNGFQRYNGQSQDISPRPNSSESIESPKTLREGLPPAGISPMKRASSAPYFAPRPLGGHLFMEDARTTQRGTSHYTTLAAPRTNSHFCDSLPGGNLEFGMSSNPWKTTHQSFHKHPELDTSIRCSKDRNFQYVDGEKYNGVASVRQRVKLPAHHNSPYLL